MRKETGKTDGPEVSTGVTATCAVSTAGATCDTPLAVQEKLKQVLSKPALPLEEALANLAPAGQQTAAAAGQPS